MLAPGASLHPSDSLVDPSSESYTALSKRWGVGDNSNHGGIDGQGGGSNINNDEYDTIDLVTLTELRARGENQRFLDDLGYIVDGLSSSGGDASMTVKRPSAVDLVRRMLSSEFRQSIKTLDESENLYKIFLKAGAGSKGDQVSKTGSRRWFSVVRAWLTCNHWHPPTNTSSRSSILTDLSIFC